MKKRRHHPKELPLARFGDTHKNSLTNWDIPGAYAEYDGYGETYLVGMLMNTENDYLDYIEKYFPGRILDHITQFSTLLNVLVTQSDVNF